MNWSLEYLQLSCEFDEAMMDCVGPGSGYHGQPFCWDEGLGALYCNGWEL